MSIKFKPIYICDGCGVEFEDKDQIRIIDGDILNGDKTKLYSTTEKMYCLSCLPLALDLENKNPETIINIDPEHIGDYENQRQFYKESYITPLKNSNKDFQKNIIDIIKDTINDTIKLFADKLCVVENSKLPNSNDLPINKQQKPLKEPVVETLKLPEIEPLEEPKIEQISEEEEIDQPTSLPFEFTEMLKDSGEIVVLYEIKNGIQESIFAKEHKLESVKSLRIAYGNKPLFGLYVPSHKFLDSSNVSDKQLNLVFDENYQMKPINIINKIIFGIPNIISRNAQVYQSYGIALIKKIEFENEIEPIQQLNLNKEETKDITENLQIIPIPEKAVDGFLNNLPVKKRFKKSNIYGDDYI